MEAVILAGDSSITFEPLSSHICVSELYVGHRHIFQETLENLWRSGITAAILVVPKHVSHKYKRFCKDYGFGKKERAISLQLVPISVNSMQVGQALRELALSKAIQGDFILLHWDTLLTVPLYEAMELHQLRKKLYTQYAQSVLYIKDTQEKRFSSIGDDSMVLVDGNQELLYCDSNSDHINLSNVYSAKLRKLLSLELRFDLCQTHVYMCTNKVIEYFVEWFDKCLMQDFIQESLTQEIATSEVYVTVLENDISFANFPAALRINTPRLYYSVYMEYIQRFQGAPLKVHGLSCTDTQASCCGPKIRENCNFINGGAHATFFEPEILENIQGCIIGKNCHVGHNSKVLNSVLFDGVVIGSNCTINGAILMDRVTIGDHVTLEQGSIIGSNCNVVYRDVQANGCSPKLAARPLYCATFESKFVNLGDSHLDVNDEVDTLIIGNVPSDHRDLDHKEEEPQVECSIEVPQTNGVNLANLLVQDAMPNGYVNCDVVQNEKPNHVQGDYNGKVGYHEWDMLPFLQRFKLYRIKDDFWNFVVITKPIYTDDDDTAYSDAEFDASSGSFLRDSASCSDVDDMFDGVLESSALNGNVKQEIGLMAMECLENPKYLSDKMLEIRSIKISQNLDENQVMLACLYSGIMWLIAKYERLELDDDCQRLQETLQECRLADMISSFRLTKDFDEAAFYDQVVLAVDESGKPQSYLGRIFEALYQCEVFSFDTFYNWAKANSQIQDDRLLSFAEWLETD